MVGAAASSLSVRPSLGGDSSIAMDGGATGAGVWHRVLARRPRQGDRRRWRTKAEATPKAGLESDCQPLVVLVDAIQN